MREPSFLESRPFTCSKKVGRLVPGSGRNPFGRYCKSSKFASAGDGWVCGAAGLDWVSSVSQLEVDTKQRRASFRDEEQKTSSAGGRLASTGATRWNHNSIHGLDQDRS